MILDRSQLHDDTYLDLVDKVLTEGVDRPDRTGVGTRSLFGLRAEYDLRLGFPLLLTKRVHWKSVLHELLWMLRGQTNVKPLQAEGVTIWDEWADASGGLGPVYGSQWRAFMGEEKWPCDQIASVLDSLRTEPHGRRHVVSAWNPADIPLMALPPCHVLFQFYVEADESLSCQLYQRSADLFLGVPFNIASYALLTHIFAAATGRGVGRFIHVLGDAHIYANHMDAVRTQMGRRNKLWGRAAYIGRTVLYPRVAVEIPKDWPTTDLTAAHVTLAGYEPMPAISAPVAV